MNGAFSFCCSYDGAPDNVVTDTVNDTFGYKNGAIDTVKGGNPGCSPKDPQRVAGSKGGVKDNNDFDDKICVLNSWATLEKTSDHTGYYGTELSDSMYTSYITYNCVLYCTTIQHCTILHSTVLSSL